MRFKEAAGIHVGSVWGLFRSVRSSLLKNNLTNSILVLHTFPGRVILGGLDPSALRSEKSPFYDQLRLFL